MIKTIEEKQEEAIFRVGNLRKLLSIQLFRRESDDKPKNILSKKELKTRVKRKKRIAKLRRRIKHWTKFLPIVPEELSKEERAEKARKTLKDLDKAFDSKL